MSLDDTPQIPFTQLTPCIDFNTSFDISSIVPYIPIISPKVSTTFTTLKSGVWKYFDKLTVNGVRRDQCKLCPDVSYSFPKNAGTGPLAWHIKSKYPKTNHDKSKLVLGWHFRHF